MNKDTNTPQTESTKLSYHSPLLTCYGDLKDLTLGNTSGSQPGGVAFIKIS